MTPPRLDAALKRLAAALGQLEAASAHVARTGADKRDLVDTLAVMQDDRGRLAGELDAALTRAEALDQATRDVAQRLGRAGGTLRRLLAETESVDDGGAPGL